MSSTLLYYSHEAKKKQLKGEGLITVNKSSIQSNKEQLGGVGDRFLSAFFQIK